MQPTLRLRQLVVYILILYMFGSLYTSLRGVFGLPIHNLTTPLLTLIAFIFAGLHAASRLGWKHALLLLILSTGISLLFESVGVATGLVYGPYHYTTQLGPRFLGLVPYIIPVAWFMMMYPSLLIAARFQPGRVKGLGRILAVAAVAGLVMTAWDTVMDPMMVQAGHWEWEVEGAYFGVPLQNYWGWWLTTFTVFAVYLLMTPRTLDFFAASTADGSSLKSYDGLAVISYALTGFTNALVAFLMGLTGPAIVGLVFMGAAVAAWFFSPVREGHSSPASGKQTGQEIDARSQT